MPLSEADRECIESFRTYIQETVATDDRYGQAERLDAADQTTLATRFMEGSSCWFEVAVHPVAKTVRVGFFTTAAAIHDECQSVIAEAGVSPEQFVGEAFGEIGLDWTQPPVEQGKDSDTSFFATRLDLEELADLETDQTRDKTIRMLEGYLLAFGPTLGAEEE